MDKLIKTQSKLIKEDFKKIKNEYNAIDDEFYLSDLKDKDYFQTKFMCHDNAMVVNEVANKESHIVTGFGPTNSPTAGTLSVMLKAISLQKETSIDTDIIISDLGAWNSRNLTMKELDYNTELFLEFILRCGFDENKGNLRTHKNFENLEISGIISKFMTEEDFKSNKEATDVLYDHLNLRNYSLGIYVDGLYTVADILNPLFQGKKRVLVLAGIEEHYFANLAKIAIDRLNQYEEKFIDSTSKVGGLYTNLVEGLSPYPKMSKSIPDSAINISDSEQQRIEKIIYCSPENDKVILQMINLVSDWDKNKIKYAREAFYKRIENPVLWMECKEEYFLYFNNMCKIWNELKNVKY